MKKFNKEQITWKLRELVWWFQIYYGRIIGSYLALSLATALILFGVAYNQPKDDAKVIPETCEQTTAKLEKCSKFVYDVLKTNTNCLGALQSCSETVRMCTEKLEQIVNDPNYREAGD